MQLQKFFHEHSQGDQKCFVLYDIIACVHMRVCHLVVCPCVWMYIRNMSLRNMNVHKTETLLWQHFKVNNIK